MPNTKTVLLTAGALLALIGCKHNSDLDETGGVKVTRSICPAVAIPTYTGDVTLFSPPQSRDASAIDAVASLTNLRNSCNDTGDRVLVNATFDVEARRNDVSSARTITLPYFVTTTRGGTKIESKQLGQFTLTFAAGQARAKASGTASTSISRAQATLAPDVQEKLNRKRKSGEAEAAVDPMTDPTIRSAVKQASFELLVGFQLTEDQLRYNATR